VRRLLRRLVGWPSDRLATAIVASAHTTAAAAFAELERLTDVVGHEGTRKSGPISLLYRDSLR
jgi:hypothetical protein